MITNDSYMVPADLSALKPALKNIEPQCNQTRGTKNQEPRCAGLLNLGPWFRGLVCMEICIEKLSFNALGPQEPRTKMPRTLESWFLVPPAWLH